MIPGMTARKSGPLHARSHLADQPYCGREALERGPMSAIPQRHMAELARDNFLPRGSYRRRLDERKCADCRRRWRDQDNIPPSNGCSAVDRPKSMQV